MDSGGSSPVVLPDSVAPPLPKPSQKAAPTAGNASWSDITSGKQNDADSLPTHPILVEDGIAITKTPRNVLDDDKPIWNGHLVGYFIGDPPHIGTVHAAATRLWSSTREYRVDAHYINTRTVLFRIDDPQMRDYIIEKKFWYIGDVPIVMGIWNPRASVLKPDVTELPMWVDLTEVPDHLFTRKGLKFIGNVVGKFQKFHPSTERCFRLDRARLMVLINLEKPLIHTVKLEDEEVVTVKVNYPWLPDKCDQCKQWGHKKKNCAELRQFRILKASDEKSMHALAEPQVERLSRDGISKILIHTKTKPTCDQDSEKQWVEKPSKTQDENARLIHGIVSVSETIELQTPELEKTEQCSRELALGDCCAGIDTSTNQVENQGWTEVKSKGRRSLASLSPVKKIDEMELANLGFSILPQLHDEALEDGEIGEEGNDEAESSYRKSPEVVTKSKKKQGGKKKDKEKEKEKDKARKLPLSKKDQYLLQAPSKKDIPASQRR